MTDVEPVSFEVIANHLLRLGGGNHDDNMRRLRRFECHCSVSLLAEEFFGLVFLQNDEVVRIAPRGDDRTLAAVARRAISLGQPRLTANWNLAENLYRMREKLASTSNIFGMHWSFVKPEMVRKNTGYGTSKMVHTERSRVRR